MSYRKHTDTAEYTAQRVADIRPGRVVEGTLIVDKYQLRAVLGSGATASVWSAMDLDTSTTVAIKVARHGDWSFTQEAHLQALVASPHVPRVLDVGEVQLAGRPGPTAYLVQELVEGPNLRDLLRTSSPDSASVAAWAHVLLTILEVAHENSVVHGDVKPANILIPITHDGLSSPHARLTDFGTGTAQNQDEGQDEGHTSSYAPSHGTILYMSPEQAHGGHATPASDIYSLGLVLLECFTGARAFNLSPMESLTARTIGRPTIPGDLTTGWRALLSAMTDLDPHARPTATQALHLLAEQPTSRRHDAEARDFALAS